MSDDDENLAAEYVLGVLDAAGRREAETRIARDAVFAADVAAWEARLAPIVASVAGEAPPERVWRGIESRLGAPPAPSRTSIWQSLRFWRGLSFGSLGVAVAAIAALFFVNVQPQAPMFAALQQTSGSMAFMVAVDPNHGMVYVMPAAFVREQQRIAELWIIPSDGRPRSLGLLDPVQPVRLAVPDSMRGEIKSDAALAVSLEPPGGSPTGLPTGPVIAQGKIHAL